ncbi:MAG: YbaK/EbsC family protein [Oscillospiraceae bacterium]
MSINLVKNYLKFYGKSEEIKEFPVSSATVDLAAKALNTVPERIAKTISFKSPNGCVLIVTAGDMKIDNAKFKEKFGFKAKMLTPDEVFEYTGHKIGGVCPFAIENPSTTAFVDISVKRFATIFPACGSSNSAIELTPDELFEISKSSEWIDVCKER